MKLLLTFCFVMGTIVQKESWKKVERNGMVFEWRIEGAHLRCKVMAPTTGWVAIGFNTHSQLSGTHLIMGAVEQEFYRIDDRYIVAPGNHRSMIQMGVEDQITLKSGREWQGKTVIEFVIPLQSKDKYHLQLNEGSEYHLLMAFSAEDDFDHHSMMRTSTKIKL
ncbi:MAG: DOMON domain-containing protein [Cyclobacteriaceae bacterium]